MIRAKVRTLCAACQVWIRRGSRIKQAAGGRWLHLDCARNGEQRTPAQPHDPANHGYVSVEITDPDLLRNP